MPISTHDIVWQFGTLTEVSGVSNATVVSAAFSVGADMVPWTNTDDVPHARFILACQWSTLTGVANKLVNIYARPINIDGTSDAVTPSVNRLATRVGYFIVYAAAINLTYLFESSLIDLPLLKASQEFEFYIENQTGQTISASWTLKIMPLALGPHA